MYTKDAHEAYGDRCEFIGCGWSEATCDVHHISYTLHNDMEMNMRGLYVMGDEEGFAKAQEDAYQCGFGTFDKKTRQLPKNDSVWNLAVLCPNHHRYVHHHDLDTGLLHYIPIRSYPTLKESP